MPTSSCNVCPSPGSRAPSSPPRLWATHTPWTTASPTATLVLAVTQAGRPTGPRTAPRPDAADEDSRTLWARAGVLVNELARPALLLNLPMEGGGHLAAEAGEPGYVSLRRLLRSPPRLAVAGRTVYVCENPNLVAIAADGLGPRCAPLVCTEGMPAAAQRTLLAQLAKAGARLLYHGDLDWPGIRIANVVMRDLGAEPWRFGAADYAAAAASASGQPLTGAPVAASWDAALAPAMQQRGLAIPEEGVAAVLLRDLAE